MCRCMKKLEKDEVPKMLARAISKQWDCAFSFWSVVLILAFVHSF